LADKLKRPPAIALGAALLGAALLALSPFLVWGKVDILIGTISQTGVDAGAGWIHLALGVAVAALAAGWLAGAPATLVKIGWLVLGVVAGALVFYELSRVHDCAFFIDQLDECVATPSYGPGLFVALVGAAATVVAAVIAWVQPAIGRRASTV
jgi:hypothetical protein